MPDPPEVHPGQRGEGLPDGGLLQGGREPLEGEVLVMRRALAQAPPWEQVMEVVVVVRVDGSVSRSVGGMVEWCHGRRIEGRGYGRGRRQEGKGMWMRRSQA